jgi:transposase-like protein
MIGYVEAALNAEMEEHLGYEKHAKYVVKNNRNGKTTKRIKRKMASLNSRHPVIAMAHLNLS